MSGHAHQMVFARHIDPSGRVWDYWVCGCCGSWRGAKPDEEDLPAPNCSICLVHGHGEKARVRPIGVVNG